MNLRHAIVFMSALAVVSDAVLIAFYPQFFEMRYGVTSSVHVGAYIAAISIAVMGTLPLWARVARHVEPMQLLVWTQLAAGSLCVLSIWADSVALYWVLSMAMFMCKSSYLLMFPYLMRLEKPEAHAAVIGSLSVVVHFGGIFGAAVGGSLMQNLGPGACLWLMAMGDFGQMLVCAFLIRTGRVVNVNGAVNVPVNVPVNTAPRAPASGKGRALLQLCLIMLLFDFSAYLVRPFFSVYWEAVSQVSHRGLTGLVFAIPGVMALLALRLNQRGTSSLDRTQATLLLGGAGLLLQAYPSPLTLLLGRCLYGWALFQVIVKLELSLFRISTPDAYARDFSIANGFQNLGVLLSSFAAGALVSGHGIAVTFVLAAAGWVLTALLDRMTLGVDRLPTLAAPQHAS